MALRLVQVNFKARDDSALGRFWAETLGWQVEPLATSGASVLSSTTRADGFVLVPRDSEGSPAGENVRVFFYDPFAFPAESGKN